LYFLFVAIDDGVNLFSLNDGKSRDFLFGEKVTHAYVFHTLADELEANPRVRSFNLKVRFAWMLDDDLAREIVHVVHDASRKSKLVSLAIIWDDMRPGAPSTLALLDLFRSGSSIEEVQVDGNTLVEICRNGITGPFSPGKRLVVYDAEFIPLSLIARFASAVGIVRMHIESTTDFIQEDDVDYPTLGNLESLAIVSVSADSARGGAGAAARFLRACPVLARIWLGYYHGNIGDSLLLVDAISQLPRLAEMELVFKVPPALWMTQAMQSLLKASALECLTIGMPDGCVDPLKAYAYAHPRVDKMWTTVRSTDIPIVPDWGFVHTVFRGPVPQRVICEDEIREKKGLHMRIAAALTGLRLGDVERDFTEYVD
jgi:hypothetical protein